MMTTDTKTFFRKRFWIHTLLNLIIASSGMAAVNCCDKTNASLPIESANQVVSAPASADASAPSALKRFIEGIDQAPAAMEAGEIENELNDPLATLLLRNGILPASVGDLLEALRKAANLADDPFPQQSFFVSESGKIEDGQGSGPLQREFRMVITWPLRNPKILISAPAGDREGFIEIMGWDDKKKEFNFYRRTTDGEWDWKGDSGNAFTAGSRTQACFGCHINGVPLMKELQSPWNNWHSQKTSIPPEAIPDEAIRNSKLFTLRKKAELLQSTVERWISEATVSRFNKLKQSSAVSDARNLLRPVFEGTTVNLAASLDQSRLPTPEVRLPIGFFLNFDTFGLPEVLGSSPPGLSPVVKKGLYNAALEKFDFRLEDPEVGFRLNGDTFFGFVTPVASREDRQIIQQLVAQNLITSHFALSVLMVDFPNPIFSKARGSLLKYVPETGQIINGSSDLSERTAQAILQAAQGLPAGSPEMEFAVFWKMTQPQLSNEATKRIGKYLKQATDRLKSQVGIDDFTRLAESRRRQFADAFRLNEFPLLLPKTNIPAAPALRMNPDGTVSPQT